MRNSLAKIILLAILVYLVSGCQQKTAQGQNTFQNDRVEPTSPVPTLNEGTSTQGGGGNFVDGRLFDLHENSKAIRVKADELLALPAVRKSLQKLYDNFPILARLLVVHANDKPWIFDRHSLNNNICENASAVDVKKEIGACQTALEIRIDQMKWLESDELTKSALIVHELLVLQVLRTTQRYFVPQFKETAIDHKKMAEAVVREIVRQLFQNEAFDQKEVLTQIKSADFRFYLDELLLKEKASVLNSLYELETIRPIDLPSDKKETLAGLMGEKEQFLYVNDFSSRGNYEKYLLFLRKILEVNSISKRCLEPSRLGSLSAFEYLRYASVLLSWDAVNLHGVKEIKMDMSSLSSLPFTAVHLQQFPEWAIGYSEYCQVLKDDFFKLAGSPFESLPQEMIWNSIREITKKRSPF